MTIQVELHGANGSSTTEVNEPKGFPTRHVKIGTVKDTESVSIAPDIPTPTEQIAAVMPDWSEAWDDNRDRLIAWLSEDLTLSEGIVLNMLGIAIENQYAPRKSMSAGQWVCLTSDLTTDNYFNVVWMRELKTRISRKYEDRRKPRTNLKALLTEATAVMEVSHEA